MPVLETTTASIKPLWRFSLLVGVKNVVSQHFGGTAQMASLIDNQLAVATKKLNATQKFSGVFLFTADSIYEYSGTIANEDAKPLYRFDYRLLYDTIDQAVVVNEIIRTRYVFLWNTQPDSLFGNVCNKWLVNLLGDLRGAFIIPMALVDATKNAVNYTAFTAIPSIMNNPEIYTSWDDYSVSIINYNAGNVGSERDIVKTAFPDTMGIMVTTASGSAVPGARIQVFGSVLDTRAVHDSTLATGLTDDNWRFVFPSNPFMTNATESLAYGTLLIITIASGDTTSTWLPLYEAGNAYFKNSTASFYKEVKFQAGI